MKALSMSAAIAIGLLTLIGPVHAEIDGFKWMNQSDDFKTGYAVGMTEMFAAFAPNEQPMADGPNPWTMRTLHECGKRKGLTMRITRDVIDAYIRQHPEERHERLALLSVLAMSNLCSP